MGRKHVDAAVTGSVDPGRRPKTLGGPLEVHRGDVPGTRPIALLNQRHPAQGLIRTSFGECAYSAAPSPLESGVSEDCLLIQPREDGVILIIADGAGGHPGGDDASRIAVSEVGIQLSTLGSREISPRTAILDGFESANNRIMKEAPGALTTLLVVEIALHQGALAFRTYHAGDTAAFVFSGRGRVRWNTVMHSPVGYAVESGLLGPDQALHHDDLNLVSSLVGGRDVRIELGSWTALKTHETLLVATDGLLDNLYRREIGKMVASPKLKDVSSKLSECARSRMLDPRSKLSKPDDCTFALFRGAPTERSSVFAVRRY